MKKAIKKLSAIAIAFTLLGTGANIVNNVKPHSISTITASAAKGQQLWQRVNNIPGRKVTITYKDLTKEVLTYPTMTVYYSTSKPSTKKICFNAAPGVPITIYRFDVAHVRIDL